MTRLPDPKPDDGPAVPPIRRPVLFYATVAVAYGLLAAAILVLAL
ncbi:hypothetical protein [uncultured Algimonas sp.]|nr:hypothetical protein [uncultured Algimonas sp.]